MSKVQQKRRTNKQRATKPAQTGPVNAWLPDELSSLVAAVLEGAGFDVRDCREIVNAIDFRNILDRSDPVERVHVLKVSVREAIAFIERERLRLASRPKLRLVHGRDGVSVSAPRPLRELPWFDEARDATRRSRPNCDHFIEAAGAVVVPGLDECSTGVLDSIASAFWIQSLERARRIRLVPPPPSDAANDSEVAAND